MCGGAGETLLGVVTSLRPHRVHQLGLSLHHPGGERVGTHLHVHDLVGLGAHSLGHVVALVMVLDDLAPGHALLVTVCLEAGDADLLSLLLIVQVTLARVALGLDHSGAMDLVHLVTGVTITGGSGGVAIASSRLAITSSRCGLAITCRRSWMTITCRRSRVAIRSCLGWGTV